MQAYAILFADFSAFSAFRHSPDRYCGLKAVNALKRRKIPLGIFSRFCGRGFSKMNFRQSLGQRCALHNIG